MPGTSFPSINGLNITEFGVFKLLDNIDVSKTSGPDCIPGRILQNLAPVLHYIFDQSLNSGDLPADWTLANVAPIFKKGSKLQAVNYRPVSLTWFFWFVNQQDSLTNMFADVLYDLYNVLPVSYLNTLYVSIY